MQREGLARSVRETEIGVETELRLSGCVVRFEDGISACCATLMLRFAANHLKRQGLPDGQDMIVASDPFDVEFSDRMDGSESRRS